jgi:hypothetical protein
MKKYLVWIGAAVLVLALASPSMAQFKSWGHLEVESYWITNQTFNKDALERNYQGVGSRYRFNLAYGDPKTVQAVLGFEANARAYGEGPQDAGATSSAAFTGQASRISTAQKGNMGNYGTDTIALQVRHAYLDFTIPNTPLTMQIGIMNQAIGGFLGRFFMNKDVPAYVLNGNFAPHTISAFWWKGYKQNLYTENDNDYWGLRYRLKEKMFNVEAWFVYNQDRRSETEAWTMPASGTNPYTYTPTLTITPRGYEQKPWWLGANVPITLGNLKVEPTVVYLGGKYQDPVRAGSATSIDFDAWLADVTVSYRVGPGLSFLVEGFYSTGRDAKKTDKMNQYMFPLMGSESRNVFGNGWSVFYFWNTELSYYAAKQLDPGGLGFGRVNAEFNPFAWLNLNVNYLYIVNTANWYVAHISGNGGQTGKMGVGSEINGIAKIAIYKDFLYTIGFGYFFPGDVFDTPTKSADQAWSLLSNLKYVF